MFVCMTQYDEKFDLPVAFPPEQPRRSSPRSSPRRADASSAPRDEKYAHVTFFFNGGREVVFPGEERVLVPSPREVKTYDLKPEMSARRGHLSRCVQAIDSGKYASCS